MFEGGVRIPLFAGGPDLDDGAVADDLFINVSDLYATILDLTGLSNPHTDSWEANQSQSFEGYLMDTTPASRVRDFIYTEYFKPNGDIDTITLDTYNKATAAITTTGGSDVWKYVEQLGGSQISLFNLSTQDGEWEDVNECASGCSATEDQIISELLECRDQFYETCQLADLDEPCDYNSDCCAGYFCASVSKTCKNPI